GICGGYPAAPRIRRFAPCPDASRGARLPRSKPGKVAPTLAQQVLGMRVLAPVKQPCHHRKKVARLPNPAPGLGTCPGRTDGLSQSGPERMFHVKHGGPRRTGGKRTEWQETCDR